VQFAGQGGLQVSQVPQSPHPVGVMGGKQATNKATASNATNNTVKILLNFFIKNLLTLGYVYYITTRAPTLQHYVLCFI
jgi:hypothetical protein